MAQNIGVNTDNCSNDNLLMDYDQPLNSINNNRIIKLWDNTCFDIDELAQYIIGSNGMNRNPYAPPGMNQPIWQSRDELLLIVNHPQLDNDLVQPLRDIVANELADIPPYIHLFQHYLQIHLVHFQNCQHLALKAMRLQRLGSIQRWLSTLKV